MFTIYGIKLPVLYGYLRIFELKYNLVQKTKSMKGITHNGQIYIYGWHSPK